MLFYVQALLPFVVRQELYPARNGGLLFLLEWKTPTRLGLAWADLDAANANHVSVAKIGYYGEAKGLTSSLKTDFGCCQTFAQGCSLGTRRLAERIGLPKWYMVDLGSVTYSPSVGLRVIVSSPLPSARNVGLCYKDSSTQSCLA